MKNIAPRTAVAGLIVGILSIPALVFAGSAVFDGSSEDVPGDTHAAAVTAAKAAAPALSDIVTTTTAPPEALAEADLAQACGDDGLALVALEADGTITALEQAALDALRPICADAGMPLPEAAPPEPVVIVETVRGASPAAAAPPAGDDRDHDEDHEDHDDDRDGDDDHDDDRDEADDADDEEEDEEDEDEEDDD